MDDDPGSALRRIVGRSLRQYREAAGYTVGDAARILECDPSKVSRVETGLRSIRAKELRELLAEYGADPAVAEALSRLTRPRGSIGWWSCHELALLAPYLDLVATETVAEAAGLWAPLQVPQLLQAKEYARAVAAADPDVPQEHEESTVAVALSRQQAVLSERKTPVNVVIGEAAVRQLTGGVTAMRRQLNHLVDLAERCPHVIIRLLPFTVGASPTSGGFTVLRLGGLTDLGLVHLDGPDGGLCLGTPQSPASYLRVLGRLQGLALSPGQTNRRLQELARALGNPHGRDRGAGLTGCR